MAPTGEGSEGVGHTGSRLPARYWRLWWAGAIDNVGTGALVTALPLLAVTLTTDARLVSTVAAASFVPWLLFALPAGVVVDRYDRIGLMQAAQVAQAVVVAAVAVLVATGGLDIVSLTVAAFLVGVGQVVFGIASQSVVPEVVERPLLARANSRQHLATTIGQSFIGPPVGSVLFGVAVALPFGLDAAVLVASVLLLTTLRGGARSRSAALPAGRAVKPKAIEGLRWLAGHRLLRTLAVLLGVNTFCFQLGQVTLVLLATDELGVTAAGYGLLLAVAAIGSLIGGLLAARLVSVFGQIPVLVVALAVNAAAFIVLGLSSDAWTLAALLALSGLATAIWNVVTVTLRQELVPLDLLGRVNSAYRLLGWGLIPLGALAGGLVAHEVSIRAGYPIAGTLRALALLISLPLLIRAHRKGQGPPST